MLLSQKVVAIQYLGTPKSKWAIHVTKATPNTHPGKETLHPIPEYGAELERSIFGVTWPTSTLVAINRILYDIQHTAYVPRFEMRPLRGELQRLSDLATQMSIRLKDGKEGLLAHGRFRMSVDQLLDGDQILSHTMAKIKEFEQLCNAHSGDHYPPQMVELAREISEIDFYCQWLVRGYLFEPVMTGDIIENDRTLRSDNLHYDPKKIRPTSQKTTLMVPQALAKPLAAASSALGRDQLEFCYLNYTLAAGQLPGDFDINAIDYDNPQSILDGIAKIETQVGYIDTNGHSADHNFRFNHVLMELQMKQAFEGLAQVIANDMSGWTQIARAAERAHKIFKTMGQGTPAAEYPYIRVPISGNYGTKPEYDSRGVFYEGIGTDRYVDEFGTEHFGAWVKDEFGQTGANSSMFKWFDIVIGIAQHRNAYNWSAQEISILLDVIRGQKKPAEIGRDALRTMQFGFDLFTRPAQHMQHLVQTFEQVNLSGILQSDNIAHLMGRLETALWVLEHRAAHFNYVNTHIFTPDPLGHQQATTGTGGSTVAFLPKFIEDTLIPMNQILERLSHHPLNPSQKDRAKQIENRMQELGNKTALIQKVGEKLQQKETSATAI